MEEILEFINSKIREEKGNRVTLDSLLIDAELDSFGVTVVLLDIDEEYDYFTKAGYGEDPWKEIQFATISIKEIVDSCL